MIAKPQNLGPVNVGEGRAATLLGSPCEAQPAAEGIPYTESCGEIYRDHIHNVNDVHTQEDPDPLASAVDPLAADLAGHIAVVEAAVALASEDPGALAAEEFQAAVRFIREHSEKEWFTLRGQIKRVTREVGVKLGDIDRMTRSDSEKGRRDDESSVTDDLVALVRERAELFHAADGACYAALKGAGPLKTYRLDTKAFAQWAAYSFFTATATDERPGCAVSETALRTALAILTGLATHDGQEREVFQRVGIKGSVYYLDLGAEDWCAVEITPGGWRVVARPPVHFWRANTLRPLPIPVAGGDLSLLWQHINVPPAARPLVLAYLLEALRPETPFPVLELTGPQGCAKSSTQAKLRCCIDPTAANLRAAPKSVEDLSVSAGANWFVSLNNLSHLSDIM